MKKTEKKKPVPTMPQGVWESSHTDQADGKTKTPVSPVTDLQGNGYPDAVTDNRSDENSTGIANPFSATAKSFSKSPVNRSRD